MDYTLEDLAPVYAVVKASINWFGKLSDEWVNAIFAKATPEEKVKFYSELQLVAKLMAASGETSNVVIALFKVGETLFDHLDRTVPRSDLIKMYTAKGLSAKDVRMLRDLGMPKLAQAFEDVLASYEIEPKKPDQQTSTRKPSHPVHGI